MSVIRGQQQTFLRLLATLRPHLRGDPSLPSRIQALFARHKEFGSRDRRLYRELIYTAVRFLPWIERVHASDPERAAKIVAWLASDTRDTAAFRNTLAGDWPATATLAERATFLGMDTAVLLPSWVRDECPATLAPNQLEALLSRAPLWLRIQPPDTAKVRAEFEAHGWASCTSTALPNAWKLLAEADVTKTEAFASGAFEVQDLGSQMILESIGIEPGGRWLDACAGAGGKTLQLAQLLGTAGTVDASDVRAAALDELVLRARRAAGAATAHSTRGRTAPAQAATKSSASLRAEVRGIPGAAAIRVLHPDSASDRRTTTSSAAHSALPSPADPAACAVCGMDSIPDAGRPTSPALYDGVLVDAPCSGSGTWRRSPHLKWATTRESLAERAEVQLRLLEQHHAKVRHGGRLVYATCSLARTENDGVIARFLSAHPEFEPAPFARTFGFEPRGAGLAILPAQHDTDGFFVASLRRR
jgi:16S rRNA (cytosine967-C5)-methyltransferase